MIKNKNVKKKDKYIKFLFVSIFYIILIFLQL